MVAAIFGYIDILRVLDNYIDSPVSFHLLSTGSLFTIHGLLDYVERWYYIMFIVTVVVKYALLL